MAGRQSSPILEVERLRTHFMTRAGIVKAVDDVSFAISAGEIMGLVGESGSGKSITGLSIMRLIDVPGRIVGGRIRFRGEDLAAAPEQRMRALRGSRIAMVFQDPLMTLNPLLRVGTQMAEAITAHNREVSRTEARARSRDALGRVGIPAPEERLDAFPHQLSGGMRQRVAIATAILNEPDLIIADEPTTALDVTIQAQILHEIRKLCRQTSTAMIWITHDFAVIAGLAGSISVMYAGRIVEQGHLDDILDRPLHPYTRGLIRSVPSRNRRGRPLHQIQGSPPNLLALPGGCAFRDRCPHTDDVCNAEPDLELVRAEQAARCFHPQLEALA